MIVMIDSNDCRMNSSRGSFFVFSAKLAIPKVLEFLLKWPTPEDVMKVDPQDILNTVKNLGLERTRVKNIKRFTGKS